LKKIAKGWGLPDPLSLGGGRELTPRPYSFCQHVSPTVGATRLHRSIRLVSVLKDCRFKRTSLENTKQNLTNPSR